MKVVIQRVSSASVSIDGSTVGAIENGLLVLLGIVADDTEEDGAWLAKKLCNLRIFNDADGVMNASLLDTAGSLLVISQFTLHALTKKGNRPSYIKAAKPEIAIPLYTQFLAQCTAELGAPIQTGQFGADMKVSLVNDGPVTIIIDSKDKK